MAPSHILQIFLWGAIQNQVHIAQRVVVNKAVQFRLLRHGHVQSSSTPVQRAELDWLLYNKPLEYAQMVLRGEMEHYLSLGCDHGRLED